MKRNKKGIYKAIFFGYILLSPSLQASEASLDNFILETTSNSAYATIISLERYQSTDQPKNANQNAANLLVEQRIDLNHVYGSVYASSNSFISSHFKIIAIVKDLI